MTITRKEIVVFPPFPKQDCKSPFIYGSEQWITLQRSNTIIHCLSGKTFQITCEFCEIITSCSFFEKGGAGYLLVFTVSGNYSVIEFFSDGRVIFHPNNGQTSHIPTSNFRSAYMCSIPSNEAVDTFSPPIQFLSPSGQPYEFYGVDLLNQIWLFTIQFDPLTMKRSLFHTNPTWTVTSICSYGPCLLVGTRQGTLSKVSHNTEETICTLHDRSIEKILSRGDSIIMIDSMDGMWIHDKSLEYYDNQSGVRGILQGHIVGVCDGMFYEYPSRESIPLSNNIRDFIVISSSVLYCLYQSGALYRIEVDASLWNQPSLMTHDTQSILRDLKRSTSSITQIQSRNQRLFDQLAWEQEVKHVFNSFTLSSGNTAFHVSDESILYELKTSLPSCVSFLLIVLEDVQGEIVASVHKISHASATRMVRIADINHSVMSTLWTLSMALIAIKDQQRVVSNMINIGSFSLLDVGVTKIQRRQGLVAPPPQEINIIDALNKEDMDKLVAAVEQVGVKVEVTICGNSKKLLLRGENREALQRVRLYLCDWMAKKMKDGGGWLINLLQQTQIEDQIQAVQDVDPGNSRKQRLEAIRKLLEVNETLSDLLLYDV